MLNTGDILDNALSKQHDDSTELRTKALTWLNESMQRLSLVRDWEFLKDTDTLTIASSSATLPSDFTAVEFISGDDWYLKKINQYTLEEAEYNTDGDTVPSGFTISSDVITFLPQATGSATLTYIKEVPNYADSTDTMIPNMFGPLLQRAVLNAVYEYESDQRTIPSIQFEQALLNDLEVKDNKLKPKPKRTKYLRGRS